MYGLFTYWTKLIDTPERRDKKIEPIITHNPWWPSQPALPTALLLAKLKPC